MKRISCYFTAVLLTSSYGAFGAPAIDLQAVVTGIDRPVAITNAGDGSGRLFITLRPGFVRIVDAQGRIRFLPDIYGQDAKLALALSTPTLAVH